MKPTITTFKLNEVTGYTLAVEKSQIAILSDFGCTISSCTLKGKEVLSSISAEHLAAGNPGYFNSFLFPFPNRIAGGRYTFEKKKYQLEVNEKALGNALHGLLTDKPFKLKSKKITDDSATATFVHTIDSKEYAGYPFGLEITMKFALSKTEVAITISAKNIGTKNAPYGVGWHPYFQTGKKIDTCDISVPAQAIMESDEARPLIPSGKIVTFTNPKGKLGKREFDTCFTVLSGHKTTFDGITMWQDESMGFIQVYTPLHRSSIAIEPMSCAPDAFNNGIGLITLAPKESISHSFGISL